MSEDKHQADSERRSAREDLRDLGRKPRLDHGTCRGCGQGILWTVTAAGKRMPLDPKPVSGMDDLGEVRTVRISHFATCPKASDFRRATRQADLGLAAPVKRWPAGTDPWAVIDEELAPAYETEDELMSAEDMNERARGALVGGDVLRHLVRIVSADALQSPVELGQPGARAKLTRFLTYRVLGLPVLVQTSSQSHPPVAWVTRNPRLLAAVEERIET